MKHRHLIAGAGTAALITSLVAGTGAAAAAPGAGSYSARAFVSQSCVAQVRSIAADKHVAADVSLCSGTVTTSESAPQTATVAEVKAYAARAELSEAQTRSLTALAAAGAIKYRDWTHTYWGGSLIEKHRGRTYWDGSKAWISSYRGYAGSHTCHSEGGIAIGWAVSPLSCTKPSAGSSADAFYRFDASVAFRGSPVTLNIGLHYSTAASGATSTRQVGG